MRMRFASTLLAVATTLIACGGGSGGPGGGGAGTGGPATGGRPVVIPTVPAGSYEADCQRLCTLAPGDTLCTAKHAEFCVARCRASTRGLPPACAECLIAAGQPLKGYTNSLGDTYCTVGGPAELMECAKACDDGGQAAPAPELETLCQLQCSFYMQDPKPLACTMMAAADCLAACRATVTADGRVCAQCVAEQRVPGRSCINDDCDCQNWLMDGARNDCMSFCDTMTQP